MAKYGNMTIWDKIATTLVTVGAINWGFVGAANLDLVRELAMIMNWMMLADILYITVGIAGIYSVYRFMRG